MNLGCFNSSVEIEVSILGIISTSGKSSIAGKAKIAKNPWQISKIWKICKKIRLKKGIKNVSNLFQILPGFSIIRDAPRVKNPEGQVVMRRAAAARRRLLICQNLGWQVHSNALCRRCPAAPSDLSKFGGEAVPPPLPTCLVVCLYGS